MIRANFNSNSIVLNGTVIRLSPMQFLVATVVWMRGRIHTKDLWDVIWGNDPAGGPEWDSLAVQLCYLNRRIRPFGYLLTTEREMIELKAIV